VVNDLFAAWSLQGLQLVGGGFVYRDKRSQTQEMQERLNIGWRQGFTGEWKCRNLWEWGYLMRCGTLGTEYD
jgi:hypothetical protein